ncbi:MAG: hypothetical protein COW19_11425 [Zetaproteobacteria bacterium CG12_big_fil_rev_8_21_14_0_65_55_1124]|nr:MAG: hypothetical protein COT53_07665 [Zetaproteobacteria bacterium CG08_land_8_20_14_0_20_55_17]PIW41829.1 MAG: hypothetical protein COW19_11425 [Zetaproteobacteria bacterium CG12_big_fil_rev_8_21_14_0_65_55_1124]PIY54065.1 MAG: hypothetical protein COZ01_01675 [Zetaproteobacteria bacterium CG_4_10_14_0_8_um_filter_55_43]PIZ40240.1 MAG: hypothetical protein COY36_00205 [Zetaproteobacteria bacterium CG_4_10_14_0_2_um_filter_55_20]PJB82464.1 MAG: hypothetical protein CO089_01305 [Zetaproteoba
MVIFRFILNSGTSRSSILCLTLLASVLLATLSMSACSTVARHEPVELKDQDVATVNKDEPAPQPDAVRVVAPNPLLEGLSAEDIASVQSDAKRVYGPSWEGATERSRYVRARILPILKDMDAPQQLQVVPVAESGYNPYAFSPVGATGLWQVMPGTAVVLGMKAPAGFDARRHVEMSTRGGVQYLLHMHAMFGNWPVALAAYHRGPGSMSRILRKYPWKPEDGLDKLRVPPVTLTYVRGILGLSALVQNGEWSFPVAWETHQVALEGPIDVNQLAEAADIDPDEIYRFNPGLNHSQYLTSKVLLHVPEFMMQPLLANAGDAAPVFVPIKVRSGDSLSVLARRHHTNVHDLKRINPGLTALLHPGQKILVPAGHLNSASPPLNPLLAQGRRIHYRVRSGDNLWNIAKRFGTTPSAIARANSIRHNKTLHPGDRLWLLARARTS